MPDRYQRIVTAPPGHFLARRVGLPVPPQLRRYRPGDPAALGPVIVGGDGPLHKTATEALTSMGVTLVPNEQDRQLGLVFDASGISDIAGLRALYDFFSPRLRSVAPGGRLVILGRPPAELTGTERVIAQQALEGFLRSLGKEARQGRTAHLVQVAGDGGSDGLESTLRFLLSPKSAYLSGQVFQLDTTVPPATGDWERPLAGRTALVTGAARGIGAAISRTLHRDGARVICLDLPGDSELLESVATEVGGTALPLSITDPDSPDRLAEQLAPGGVDIVVHNAGITRDRTLARMSTAEWDSVLDVNLAAQYRITRRLLDGGGLRDGARVVCLSSVSGIAGNLGQTNYAASKSGVLGLVRSLAPELRERGGTINAVAPGFIETRLTARMPLVVREVGRRANSLAQAGLPIDVAEAVAWLAQPGSAPVTAQTVRVCGQSLLGA